MICYFVSKNLPHADKATAFVDIGVENCACDGHCGGHKGVVGGKVHVYFDLPIWRPNFHFDLHNTHPSWDYRRKLWNFLRSS